MPIQALQDAIPDVAKDIRLNLSSVLTPEGSPGLTPKQIAVVALSCAYAVKNDKVVKGLRAFSRETLNDAEIRAAQSAASIMAMNNVYYRFIHLVSDKDYATMPAKLRMSVIGNSGMERTDFELCSLAVSAINGCGMCMDAHARQLVNAGITKEGVQSAVRIGAVITAANQAIHIAALTS